MGTVWMILKVGPLETNLGHISYLTFVNKGILPRNVIIPSSWAQALKVSHNL
jgi:hypothetical protein